MGSVATFSAAPQTLSFDGFLFDFDGTIVDSTEAIIKFWHRLGKEQGLDAKAILHYSHGRRTIEVLQKVWPEAATMEKTIELEGSIPRDFGDSCKILPGAQDLLNALNANNCPWTVVTSGTYAMAGGWMQRLNLAKPKNLVVAEDVTHGKPHPEPYLMGQKKLGFEAGNSQFCVFEDAPSGIEAGKKAGMTVIALATTHTVDRLKEAGADVIVRDLASVVFQKFEDGKIVVEVRDALTE
ncbi:hypothetical protein KEM55_006365 [Ascosphaera atra]|nr:hypothetical protein KEM55_006365 [Ascosphaera atra]